MLIAGRSEFTLDSSEIEAATRGEPSYTVHTLQRLRREFGPEQPLAWILGADAFLGLPDWHHWQEIPELCHLLVTTRPGAELNEATLPATLQALRATAQTSRPEALQEKANGLLYFFTMPPQAVSATDLRQRLAQANARTDGLIPPALRHYIHQHQLYC